MRFRWILSIPAIFVALMLVMAGSSYASAQVADSTHINKLLSEAEGYSGQAAKDAEELESYTRTPAEWETHNAQVEVIREHVNHLGEVVKQLNDAREMGSPWQQTAIDRINPLLHEVAMQLTATIQHLNDHPNQVHMKPYQDFARATYEVNRRAYRVIADLVDYGKAASRARALEQKLELPASGAMQ